MADPHLFALPPGADFARGLVSGLKRRMQDSPPEAMAMVELIVNTRRMERRVRSVFRESPGFLPRIRLLTDLVDPLDLADVPKVEHPMRRKLVLTRLVRQLIETAPSVAARSSAFDLAESLAALLDEMQAENVSVQEVLGLDVTDQSGHWARACQFLGIVTQYLAQEDTGPDLAEVNRAVLARRFESWETSPPSHPIIVAGTTGSRGTAFELVQKVAQLPYGSVVLPGFDFNLPETIWDGLKENLRSPDAMQGEDHPQFRFAKLLSELGVGRDGVQAWDDAPAPCPERNKLVSLALRPAPVTNQWLSEGPKLPSLLTAMEHVTMLDAPTPRDEARVIAMRLRQAAEDGITAALISPDRMLTRRVSAMLDRWGILPDDSAGTPAHLSAPGRLLRHVAELATRPVTADAMLTLLKHPLTHSGAERGQHLIWTSELELFIRRKGIPFPTLDALNSWKKADEAKDWLSWIDQHILASEPDRVPRELASHVERHVGRSEAIVAGSASSDCSELWAMAAGQACTGLIEVLTGNASQAGRMTPSEYLDLFEGALRGEDVRDRDAPHPNILIWGTIEARVMGADLVILGGLNEGTWPSAPPADPWLNRALRKQAGLLLPERRIGLSAHDFQQAIGADEVWLTRSMRSDDAETVPSRWLNRLTNLLQGLPNQKGPDALEQSRERGSYWLRLADALDQPIPSTPAIRPSPVPPLSARPKDLSVTRIEKLIRDPYAIYASKILRLDPLNPVQKAPDAAVRGTLIHSVFETFIKATKSSPELVTEDALIKTAREILDAEVPWPTERIQWLTRVEKIAGWFVEHERERRETATPQLFERQGKAHVSDPPFTVTAKVDRIDIGTDGRAYVYDYKTGAAPNKNQQLNFSLQLLLTAAILEEHGFEDVAARAVADARYISLAASPKEVPAPLDESPSDVTWARLQKLLQHYADPDQGYPARNALFKDSDVSDYDQLSRFGEWDISHPPVKVRLT